MKNYTLLIPIMFMPVHHVRDSSDSILQGTQTSSESDQRKYFMYDTQVYAEDENIKQDVVDNDQSLQVKSDTQIPVLNIPNTDDVIIKKSRSNVKVLSFVGACSVGAAAVYMLSPGVQNDTDAEQYAGSTDRCDSVSVDKITMQGNQSSGSGVMPGYDAPGKNVVFNHDAPGKNVVFNHDVPVKNVVFNHDASVKLSECNSADSQSILNPLTSATALDAAVLGMSAYSQECVTEDMLKWINSAQNHQKGFCVRYDLQDDQLCLRIGQLKDVAAMKPWHDELDLGTNHKIYNQLRSYNLSHYISQDMQKYSDIVNMNAAELSRMLNSGCYKNILECGFCLRSENVMSPGSMTLGLTEAELYEFDYSRDDVGEKLNILNVFGALIQELIQDEVVPAGDVYQIVDVLNGVLLWKSCKDLFCNLM